MTSCKTGLVHGHILPPLVLTFLPCLPSSPPACSGCNRHWKHQITSDHSHLKSIPKAGAPTVRFTPVFMAALFTLANKVETTQLSINRGIDKNVVHTCNKMLRSHKNGDKVLMCAATGVSLGSATESVKSALRCNRGKPWEHYGISETSPALQQGWALGTLRNQRNQPPQKKWGPWFHLHARHRRGNVVETEIRTEVTRAEGRTGHYCSVGTGFLSGWWKHPGNARWWWMVHNTERVLVSIKCTLQWLLIFLLCTFYHNKIKKKNHPAWVLYLFDYEAVCLHEVPPSWLIRTSRDQKGFFPSLFCTESLLTLLPKEQALCVLAILLLHTEFHSSNFEIWNFETQRKSWNPGSTLTWEDSWC